MRDPKQRADDSSETSAEWWKLGHCSVNSAVTSETNTLLVIAAASRSYAISLLAWLTAQFAKFEMNVDGSFGATLQGYYFANFVVRYRGHDSASGPLAGLVAALNAKNQA